MAESLHQVLHAHVHEAQERINKLRILDGLTRPDYPLRSYWLVLSAYYHFYRFLEDLIESALERLECEFDYVSRRKHGWLRHDLVDSFHIDPEDVFWRPVRKYSPIMIADQVDLVGALYAIEGATLARHVMSRRLNLGLVSVTLDTGGRFFHGYGEQTTLRWNEFIDFAEKACPDAARREKAGHAALAVFAEIEAALDDYSTRADRSLRPRT